MGIHAVEEKHSWEQYLVLSSGDEHVKDCQIKYQHLARQLVAGMEKPESTQLASEFFQHDGSLSSWGST